jgi:hypothetical protein
MGSFKGSNVAKSQAYYYGSYADYSEKNCDERFEVSFDNKMYGSTGSGFLSC